MNSHQTCLSRDPDTLTRVPPLNNRRELHASVLFSDPSPPRAAKTVPDYANIGCRGSRLTINVDLVDLEIFLQRDCQQVRRHQG